MTKRKVWPEEPDDNDVEQAALAALEFLDGMILRGGHSGPASDLTDLAARLRAAMYPES